MLETYHKAADKQQLGTKDGLLKHLRDCMESERSMYAKELGRVFKSELGQMKKM